MQSTVESVRGSSTSKSEVKNTATRSFEVYTFPNFHRTSCEKKTMLLELVLLLGCFLVVLLVASTSEVPEKYIGIPYRFDAIVADKPDVYPGLSFHYPFIEEVQPMR